MKLVIAAIIFALAGVGALCAQEGPGATFNIGAGYTQPVGIAGQNLDAGWNVRGGVGYNFTDRFGLKLNLGFDSMGINSTVLNNFGVPGGDVHVFSATVDPVVRLFRNSRFNFYLTGGGGFFHWYQEFTQPSVAVVPGFNPFFGFFSAAVPATQVLSSYSVNKPGVDVGAGIEFGSRKHGKFFAEARYDHVYMAHSHADFIPVTFGFRW